MDDRADYLLDHVAINLNPYQGLKRSHIRQCCHLDRVAINLNPYQGLKLCAQAKPSSAGNGCNQPKSLSGIETYRLPHYLGANFCCNQPKSLSGIETSPQRMLRQELPGCNQPKSLSGIETLLWLIQTK